MTRQEYDAISAINYSTLSKLHQHPKMLIAPPKELEIGQIKGSLIDCFMFPGEATFEERFYTSSAKLPTERMFDLLTAYEALSENPYPINNDILLQANQTIRLGGKWTAETVINKFTEACDTYLREKQDAGDKLIVDQATVDNAYNMSTRALTNPFVNKVLTTENGISGNQVVIVWHEQVNGQNITCKAALDNLAVTETSEGVLCTINDGKFSSQGWNTFVNDYIHWNYHLQEAMYKKAVLGLMLDNDSQCSLSGVKELINNPEVKVAIGFNFIVISDSFEPLINSTDDETFLFGLKGGTLSNGIIKKGTEQLIQELLWHRETGYYDYPKDIYDNKGIVELKVNYKPF